MKNLRYFEVVVEIARYGSISKAAEILKISQSTLSKLLQKIESEIKLELFDRTVQPLRLTSAGRRFLQTGERILELNQQLEKELEDIRNSRSKNLKIGISPSRAPYLLPEMLSKYLSSYPESKVMVKEGNQKELSAALLRGELDLIISLLDEKTSGFPCIPLFRETILLATQSEFAEMDPQTILRTQPFISIARGLNMWKTSSIIIKEAGGTEPHIECQSIESAFSLVKAGMGAMLVPSYLTKLKEEKIIFKKLPEEYYKKFQSELERKVCIFYRSESFLTSAEIAFIEGAKTINKPDW